MSLMTLPVRVDSVRIASEQGKANYVSLSGFGWQTSLRASDAAAAHASKMINKELSLVLDASIGTEAIMKFKEARTVMTLTINELTDEFVENNPGRSKSASSAATSAA